MPEAALLHLPARQVSRDEAELMAIDALAFLGEDEGRLHRFLGASGITAASLRDAARAPVFLLGVMDYLAGNEDVLGRFSSARQIHPQTVMTARQALAPRFQVKPPEPSPSIVIQCEHCGTIEIRRRRTISYAPATAVRLRIARCGPCGGGFDQPETWLDAEGREVG